MIDSLIHTMICFLHCLCPQVANALRQQVAELTAAAEESAAIRQGLEAAVEASSKSTVAPSEADGESHAELTERIAMLMEAGVELSHEVAAANDAALASAAKAALLADELAAARSTVERLTAEQAEGDRRRQAAEAEAHRAQVAGATETERLLRLELAAVKEQIQRDLGQLDSTMSSAATVAQTSAAATAPAEPSTSAAPSRTISLVRKSTSTSAAAGTEKAAPVSLTARTISLVRRSSSSAAAAATSVTAAAPEAVPEAVVEAVPVPSAPLNGSETAAAAVDAVADAAVDKKKKRSSKVSPSDATPAVESEVSPLSAVSSVSVNVSDAAAVEARIADAVPAEVSVQPSPSPLGQPKVRRGKSLAVATDSPAAADASAVAAESSPEPLSPPIDADSSAVEKKKKKSSKVSSSEAAPAAESAVLEKQVKKKDKKGEDAVSVRMTAAQAAKAMADNIRMQEEMLLVEGKAKAVCALFAGATISFDCAFSCDRLFPVNSFPNVFLFVM